MHLTKLILPISAAILAALGPLPARAADKVVIGDIDDMSGLYADVIGPKAVEALKSDADGRAVAAKMKEMPTDDPLFGKGAIRVDGRKVHPTYLFEVKTPEESKYPGDLYKLRATIPADEAFRPLKQGGCPLVSG